MSMFPTILTPAPEVKATTPAQVVEAWLSGKDFLIDGQLRCSIRDKESLGSDFNNPSIALGNGLYESIF